MSSNNESKAGKLITDSTLILAVLTGLAYFLGTIHLAYYWHYLGVESTIQSESSFYGTVVEGSFTLFEMALFFSVVLLVFPILFNSCPKFLANFLKNWRNEIVKFSGAFLRPILILFGLIIFIMACTALTIKDAKTNSDKAPASMKKVKLLVTNAGTLVENPEELMFFGKKDSFELFKRTAGPNAGEFVLIPDTEIKQLVLK